MDQTLLGPVGALVGALVAVTVLWRTNVGQLKQLISQKDQQIAYTEARRLEERQARIEAENRLDRALSTSQQGADLASRYEALVRERVK